MNKRIAVRLLKAVHEKLGIKGNYVCNLLTNEVYYHEHPRNPSTVKAYEITLNNLLKCIDKSQLKGHNTLTIYIKEHHRRIFFLDDFDMTNIRKAWILAMIEHIQEGKIPDNKFLTKFLNSL